MCYIPEAKTRNGKDHDISNYSEHFFDFTPAAGRKVQAIFDEPVMTSDAGALLLRELLEQSTVVREVARIIETRHRTRQCKHPTEKILRQRVAQICTGYFTADDSDALRDDPAMLLAAGGIPGEDALASQPTVSRLENAVDARMLLQIGYALLDDFIGSFEKPPEAVVLDMDPTAIEVYGEQQLALFNAHEDGYCLMPFHVYDGLTGKLITTVIRPGKSPNAKEILALLRRLVKRLRAVWPRTRLIFRADSHHTKPEVMDYLEEQGVDFVTGLAKNAALERLFAQDIAAAKLAWDRTLSPVRRYASADYAARSWGDRQRRVICRIQVSSLGVDVRYIVTSYRKSKDAKYLYDTAYCGRACAELMIKDHKLDLGGDHASCRTATANQFRLYLHSIAYTIMHRLRASAEGSALATARFGTIMLRLLKVAARVDLGKRRIRFHLPASFPFRQLFTRLADALRAGSGANSRVAGDLRPQPG